MTKKALKNALIISSLILTSCANQEVKEPTDITTINWEPVTTQESTIEDTQEEIEELEVEEVKEPEHVDLLMIGDVLVHKPVYTSGIQEDGTLNYDHFFINIQDDLDEAEIKIVNQETILGGTELGFSSYPCFNSPQEIGDAEAKAGFNVILHATNHSMDKGFTAINNTINFWREKYPEIKMIGLNLNEEEQNNIQIYEQNGFKIALLNYTYGTNGIPLPSDKPYLVNLLDKDKVTNDILKAKEEADFVVVLPHWGTEYQYGPDTLQQEYTQLFSDLGVDLVIGTHPHVLENIEVITNDEGHEMLVFYSLGNYVSGQNKKDRVIGGMAKVSIEKDYETNECYITEYELDPVITQQGEYTVYKLEDYNDELANQNRIRNQSGCSDFNMEYINDKCSEILGETFNQEQEKVLVKIKK
jgi:poly-gamma-glutamate synthesis protein (capsule biosynthesis protein)